MKKVISVLFLLLMCASLFVGCSGSNDTVETFVIAQESYTTKNDIEAAPKTESLEAGKEIFASVHFVESPQGMEYKIKWYLNNNEIKSETKATTKGPQDIVVYSLEADKATAGSLKVEIIYKDTVLTAKELPIK